MADIEFIELAIKIPKITYEATKKYNAISIARDEDITEWILKGKVIPKGHGRLIDVKDLKKDLVYMSDYSDAKGVWEEDIDDAETIIEADKEGINA